MDIVLRKLGFAAAAGSEEQAAFRAAFASLRALEAGQDLIRQGDRPVNVHALLEGVLCRYKTLPSGARQIIGFILPGDVFDLEGLTLPRADHSIGALTRVRVAAAAHSAVAGVIRAYPRLGLLLGREATVEMAVLREWVVNCGRRTAYERISHLLCEVYARLEAVGLVEDASCALPLTQVILSDATGLSTVHVNRVLQQLRAEGLIALRSNRLTIFDREGLAAAAGFDPLYLHLDERAGRPGGTAAPGLAKAGRAAISA